MQQQKKKSSVLIVNNANFAHKYHQMKKNAVTTVPD